MPKPPHSLTKKFHYREFYLLASNNVEEDQMLCELYELQNDTEIFLGEVICGNDNILVMHFDTKLFIPVEIMEWWIEIAKQRLFLETTKSLEKFS